MTDVEATADKPPGIDEHRGLLLTLLERLEVPAGEVATISLALQRGASDGDQLIGGSVLIGPLRMGELSWPEWADADNPGRRSADLSVYGVTPGEWGAFDHCVEGWRLVRTTRPVPQALDWLAELLQGGEGALSSELTVTAHLEPADSLLQLFQHVTTPACKLAAMAGRPLLGWMHPIRQSRDAPLQLPPSQWAVVPGQQPFAGTLLLLGMSVDGWHGTDVARGLLVARLQGDAWFAGMRGGHPDLQTFDVTLRSDPSRVALWELVVDLEELDGTGALLSARRLRLADLALPPHGAESVTIKLPTLGRRLTRRLRLYNLQGRLLDATDDVILAEQISITLRVNESEGESLTIGNNAKPNILQRLEALDRSEREHVHLLEAGMSQRVVVNGPEGRRALRGRLGGARLELLIYDPYFGKQTGDWDLLDEVSVPVRLLTSADVSVPSTTAGGQSLLARRWTAQPIPFHDRGYLWREGGLSVGTSPNGLGNRVTIIDVMAPPVAARMIQLFESWWSDANALPLVGTP